jgi:hypothetical protein
MKKKAKKPLLAEAVDVFGDPLPEEVSAESLANTESLQIPATELEPVEETSVVPFIEPPVSRKARAEQNEEEDDSRIRVGDDVIDARLSRKQKIAILVRAITSGDLTPIDLIRAMQMHTDLSGDDGSGQIYELKVVLDA